MTAPDAVLRYGPLPDHLVDVHLPASRTAAALVILVHGGFWRDAYDRVHTRPMAADLRQRGFVVATPEYRRTGSDGGWPATFDDVAAVRERLPALLSEVLPGRVDVERPVLLGHSAGGHLALWWSLTGHGEPVVALAPVADLERAYDDNLDDGAVAALLGGSPAEQPERYAAANTARLLRERPVEAVVLHGTADAQVPVEHSRGLAGVRLVELPDVDHFALIDPASQAWTRVLDAVAQLGGGTQQPLASSP